MINILDYFSVEELSLLNSYWEFDNREQLLNEITFQINLTKDTFVLNLLQNIYSTISNLPDQELEWILSQIPYNLFENNEEFLKEERVNLLHKKIIEKYGIVEDGNSIDPEDLETAGTEVGE